MTNELVTDAKALLAKLEAVFAPAVAEVKSDAVDVEQWLVTNAYPLVKQDALAFLTGILTGTPWTAVVTEFTAQVVAQGKTLLAGAADVALNLAKAQLVVSGTVAPVIPATTPAA